MNFVISVSTNRCLCREDDPCGEQDTWCPMCRLVPPSQGCVAIKRRQAREELDETEIEMAPGDMREVGWDLAPGGTDQDWYPEWTMG
jgi:hypothetical protein